MPAMPRQRSKPAEDAPPPSTAPALDIRPDGIYRTETVMAALGICRASIRKEWREGRLRVVRRCGKNYLIGRDVLAWLDGGELPSPSRHPHVHEAV
jgi:hypothetical protein